MTDLVRFPDWQDRLSNYLAQKREEPFEWGKHDCISFACGAIRVQTGTDLLEGQGEYFDKKSAAAYLRKHGYRTLAGTFNKRVGKPVDRALAGKGDIVLRGKAVGVCIGKFSWFIGEEPTLVLEDGRVIYRHGLVSKPTLECTLAWKVG